MKKDLIIVVLTILILIGIFETGVYGKQSDKLVKGEAKIPQEIKNITSISEIKPFLDSKDSTIRMVAVKRLVEIGGVNSIDLLYETFNKEPYKGHVKSAPIVKLEIIRSLKNIGGDKAKKVLLDILTTYLERGPLKGSIYVHDDGDYNAVVSNTANVLFDLYNNINDLEIYLLFKRIAQGEMDYHWWIKEDSYLSPLARTFCDQKKMPKKLEKK